MTILQLVQKMREADIIQQNVVLPRRERGR